MINKYFKYFNLKSYNYFGLLLFKNIEINLMIK